MIKKFKHILLYILGFLGAVFIYLITVSVRKKIINKENGFSQNKYKDCIYALWHNRLFLLAGYFRFQNICGLVSKSKDGELISIILSLLGYETARGSSSKGGALGLLNMLKKKQEILRYAITVDGPRGPSYEVKDGIIMLALKTGLPIIPVTYKLSKKIEINSWDKFIIPYPFSKAEIIFGKPIVIDKDLDEKKIASYKEKIKQELDF